MRTKPLLPLPDYQRIYQVIYSVLEASEIAITHRACIFFASVGAKILRDHYNLPATISAGFMSLMVDEQRGHVIVYGRNENGVFVNDENAFHAWVECNGWLIDFMAPIMGVGLQKDGINCAVPRRMLQKHMGDCKGHVNEVQHVGEFFVSHDSALTELLIDGQHVQFFDLMNVCLTWYRKPPKQLKELLLEDSNGPAKKLTLRAPSIEGIW